jgi:hypothetical protein
MHLSAPLGNLDLEWKASLQTTSKGIVLNGPIHMSYNTLVRRRVQLAWCWDRKKVCKGIDGKE